MKFDVVIQGGDVVDGTGGPTRTADVGVVGDRIVAVGKDLLSAGASAGRVIDARGKLVTPGFVDIHTHYDAQATWDPEMSPSGGHGVTTVVMGSCGVGFAPVRNDEHEWLIGLMEGVEDIPGSAMVEGIKWGWESFPEYLDAVAKLPRVLDVGAQIAHGPLRAYVMGKRGAKNETATVADSTAMRGLVKEALDAGALGFSTSRTSLHRAIDGELVPGTTAAEDELQEIGLALKDAGHGVFVAACEHKDLPVELDWIARLAKRTGRRCTVNLSQIEADPGLWRQVLERIGTAQADGSRVFAQVAGRAIGVVMGLELTAHPLLLAATYLGLHHEPLADRVKALRDPETRARLLADDELDLGPLGELVLRRPDKIWVIDGAANYEPESRHSIAAIAQKLGTSPRAVALDALLRDDGRGLLYRPLFNYADDALDMVREAHLNPHTLMGLSDAGAHCGAICDGGMPTFMLTFWGRDRSRGERLPMELIVRRQTRDTARFFGMHDRGVLAPGFRADLNVIDLDKLALQPPRVAYDLPAGGRRLTQDAVGYDVTMCRGAITVEADRFTGARPGQLVRGPQAAPSST
ncbi:MAG: amidohydrolase family protein [Deltaproteobacteria bacterium]|nr:amidohydrolase family protein [Deltaproteobacteria bacterium]